MIVGVTGPICAGTDTFMGFLEEEGFISYSYSDVLRDILANRGLEITREGLQDLGDELRREKGNGAISRILIERMREGRDYVVGNIRNPGEVEELRNSKNYSSLVMIYSPVEVRFERVRRRSRESDPQTLEEFIAVERRDLGEGQESYGQQHGMVFKMADYILVNDGSLEEFKSRSLKLLNVLRC